MSRAEVHPPTTVVHGSLGGTASSHKQVSFIHNVLLRGLQVMMPTAINISVCNYVVK